jgi:hypothetical protein
MADCVEKVRNGGLPTSPSQVRNEYFEDPRQFTSSDIELIAGTKSDGGLFQHNTPDPDLAGSNTAPRKPPFPRPELATFA